MVVSLAPGFVTKRKAPVAEPGAVPLIATCGTILERLPGNSEATDVFTDKPLTYPPNQVFQCSSDRRVVAGWMEKGFAPGGSDLLADLVVKADGAVARTIQVALNAGTDFGVSPGGGYIAYFEPATTDKNKTLQLCVAEFVGSPSCTTELSTDDLGSASVSVSDSGEVVYLSKFGVGSANAVESGINYWHPGLAKPQALQPDGVIYVQLIAPQTVARLHEWASTLKQ